uniref:Uncharacterized protein n=1 Tax=Peronospora matthiolae TaxID=2874970 RepID=A0AAV1T5P6_9STRA
MVGMFATYPQRVVLEPKFQITQNRKHEAVQGEFEFPEGSPIWRGREVMSKVRPTGNNGQGMEHVVQSAIAETDEQNALEGPPMKGATQKIRHGRPPHHR